MEQIEGNPFSSNHFFILFYTECFEFKPKELSKKVGELELEIHKLQKNCLRVQEYQKDLLTITEIWVTFSLTFFFLLNPLSFKSLDSTSI